LVLFYFDSIRATIAVVFGENLNLKWNFVAGPTLGATNGFSRRIWSADFCAAFSAEQEDGHRCTFGFLGPPVASPAKVRRVRRLALDR
jgi:hypothetical protein